MPYTCDGLSVGVLLFDDHDRLLMITRAKPPEGIAPVSGHVRDENPDFTHLDAAVSEAHEEVGLTITRQNLTQVYARWQPNRCGATVPHPTGGHDWRVYRTHRWGGDVVAAEAEVEASAWYSLDQVQYLADRTIAYAHGRIPEADWKVWPGLEPVWVDILAITPRARKPYTKDTDFTDAFIRVPDYADLAAVQKLYTAP